MSGQEFGRYPQYRESGYEWLGDIPAHWDLKPLKHLCSFAGGSTPAKENLRYWVGGTIPWVSPKDMKVFWLSKSQDKITEAAVEESSLSRVAPGALLMVVRSGILQRTIPVALNTVGVTLNQDMKALTFSGPMGAEYFAYLVQGHTSALLQRWTKEGATVESVEHEFLANDSIPDVPPGERHAIVTFLDYETAKIDALIEKQQQLIALLKEKRQAVISHAVTKGLNPDAPLRDSGVEWLGEIPAHWEVVRLKHSCEIQSGMPKGKPASAATVEMPMLRVANVQDGWLNLDDVHQIPIERSQIARYLLQSGDVLMNEGGDRDKLGRGTIWRGEVPDCIHQNHVFAIRPLSVEPEWLDAVTRADYAKFHFYLVAKQSTNLASISSSNIKETPLVLPPVGERKEILDHINLMTAKTSATIELADRQNVLLQERRTALISAAVTGKIDVRNWKSPDDE